MLVLCATGVASAAPATPGFIVPSFGTAGNVLNQFGQGVSPQSTAGGVVAASDGDIYQVGSASTASGYDLYIARYLPSGAPDTSFGTDGVTYENVGTGPTPFTASPTGLTENDAYVALAPNGDPVVLTTATTASGLGLAVIEFTQTGQLNGSFGSGGVSAVAIGALTAPGGLAVESNGDIVFTGAFQTSTSAVQFVAGRLTASGAVDSSFGTDGLLEPTLSGSGSIGAGVIAQSNGDLVFDALIAGTPAQIAVTRVTASGQLDTSFGIGGVTYLPDPFTLLTLNPGLAATPGGGYAIASSTLPSSSSTTLAAAVTRLTASGQLDTAFGTSGTAVASAPSMGVTVADGLFAEADGKLIVTGLSVALGNPQPFVSRLDADGSIDASFGNQGVSLNPVPGSREAFPLGAAETPDGSLLVTGDYGVEGFLQEINLDTAPTTVFAYSPGTVQTGSPVQFVAAAATSDGYSITGLSWDFGSGSFGAATGSSVSHTFTTPGTYTVRVQATDSFGLSTVSSQTIIVVAAAQATVTPAQAIAPTLKLVQLSASHGKVRAMLLCAFASCQVDANLTTHAHARKGKAAGLSASGGGRTVTVGSSKLSLGVNQIRTVTVRLDRAGRKLLAAFKKIPAKASFRLTNVTPAKTTSHRITIG